MRLCLIVLVIGLVLAVMGWTDGSFYRQLDAEGVVVPGEITGGESRSGRRSSSYQLDVLFYPEPNRPLNRTFDVSKSFFGKHAGHGAITNPNCEVKYLPSDPKKSILVGSTTNKSFLLWPGVIAAILGFVGTIATGVGKFVK